MPDDVSARMDVIRARLKTIFPYSGPGLVGCITEDLEWLLARLEEALSADGGKAMSEMKIVFDVEDHILGAVKLVQRGTRFSIYVGPREIQVETVGEDAGEIVATGMHLPPFPEEKEDERAQESVSR